jgi:hypothetical protein
MERVLLKLTLIAVISVHLVSITQGSPVDSAKKTEVEDFLNTGLREPEGKNSVQSKRVWPLILH